MKAISAFLVLVLAVCPELVSQVPSGFKFQAVARDQQYSLIKHTTISVTIAIRSGSADGVLEWEEVHATSTNEFGLFSLDICTGNELRSGGSVQDIKDIPWAAADHYLDLKIDAGNGIVSLGSTRLLSVPYSLVSSNISQPVTEFSIQPDREAEPGDALFEVRRADGYPVFAVYEDGVWVYTDTIDSGKGVKGGFAVGGYARKAKGPAEEYFRVTPDSTRVYVKNPETKGVKGGFAIGGYSRKAKGVSEAFLALDQDNYFIGQKSGSKITTGLYNSVIGYESGFNITSGESNAFMGYQSGYLNRSGTGNLFLGYQSGYSNIEGNYNTFIGYKTGYSNQGGVNNTFLGSFSGHKNTEGTHNTFVGDSAGYNNETGGFNTFIGTKAGYNSTGGFSNVFVGPKAGYSNTLGFSNVFIGRRAGYSSTTAGSNVIIGNHAGRENTGGWSNIYIGTRAGVNNLNGSGNVFLGYECGLNNEYGEGNVFIGNAAGYPETGSHKLYISDMDGDSANVMIWGDFQARKLRFNSQLGIGKHPEYANLEIQEGWGTADLILKGPGDDYNYSLVSLESDEADMDKAYSMNHTKGNNFSLQYYNGANYLPRLRISPEGHIILGSWGTGTEMLDVNGNARFRAVGSAGSANDLRITADGTLTTNTSDARLKEDLKLLEHSLEKVLQLDGYTFQWNGSGSEVRDAGLIAQEVQEVFPEAVFTNQADGYMGINYSRFPALFVEAMKEQQSIIETQKTEIEKLKSGFDQLNQRLAELEAQ